MLNLNKLLILILGIAVFFASQKAKGQVVFEHITNTSIYEYLDEAANLGYIELNSAVKPYSRMFIYEKLQEIQQVEEKLNNRQKSELEFFMKEYIKESRRKERRLDFLGKGLKSKKVFPFKNRDKRYDLFFYSDTNFTVTINPVGGGTAYYNENGFNAHRYVGAEMFGYAWKFGFYGSLRDHYEIKYLSDPNYLTQRSSALAKGQSGKPRE